MKSVVVEASTVAKAIELAWQKAAKPEEFFIRILQEHTSGFLGFGAQKAKIVFFFKNSQKSDSLFPTVLKQKEYASLFHNDKLKAPSQLNVIDNELNKNVALGQKKKQHPNKQNHQARQATPDAKPHHSQATPVKNQQQIKPQFNTIKTQVKIELPVKSVAKQEPSVKKDEVVKKPQIQAPKAPQAPKVVQTPKVVASQLPVVNKVEEFVMPQSVEVKSVGEVVKVQPLAASVATSTTAPRVITKLKRRPLTGVDQGVSGITRSSEGSLGLVKSSSGITRSSVTQPSLKVVADKKPSFDLSKPISELVDDVQDFDLDVIKKNQPSHPDFAQGSKPAHKVSADAAVGHDKALVDTDIDKGDQE